MEKPSTRTSLLTHIRSSYGTLAPAERRIADLILNFPGELPGYSASELARIAGTSNAAVSRLVRRLGYQRFEEMRLQAREERESGAPLYLLNSAVEGGDHGGGVADDHRGESAGASGAFDRHVDRVVDNLRQTAGTIDKHAMLDLAEAIAGAARVWVVGFRHSHFLAGYLRWSLSHVRPGVRLLPVGGETFGENLAELSAGDVLILYAFRRRITMIDRIASIADASGARMAIMADPAYAPMPAAEWVFFCQTKTHGPFDDHASAFVLAHTIIEQVTAFLGPAARDRLGRIDDIHDGMQELARRGGGG